MFSIPHFSPYIILSQGAQYYKLIKNYVPNNFQMIYIMLYIYLKVFKKALHKIIKFFGY